MTTRDLLRPTLIAFAALIGVRLVVAALTPVTEDEAYYLVWSTALDLGYFDHPPVIAWINALINLVPGSALAGRIGTMGVAALAFPFTVGLLQRIGLTDRRSYLAGLLLASFNGFVLLAGTLTTPDAVLIAAWAAALHECAAAVSGDRRRWLTAGLAAGLGLLGKYTMVLIGPVFLWAVLACDRRALRTPWPWVGAFVTLLVFAPHLGWNAQHEWVSMRMQLGHGIAGSHDPGFAIVSDLPPPDNPTVPPRPDQPTAAGEGVAAGAGRAAKYLGGLLALWGLMFPIVIWRGVAALGRTEVEPAGDRTLRPLLHAATWVPIAFFACFTPLSDVQANWAGAALISGGLLLAPFGGARLRWVVVSAAANLVLLLALGVYAAHPEIAASAGDRVLKETLGWSDLADRVAELDGPVLTDREQPTSMIRFYRPDVRVSQWPGMTQPSEFVRRPEWSFSTLDDLERAGGFWLVGVELRPLEVAGFRRVGLTALRSRLGDAGLEETPLERTGCWQPPCSDATVHTWFLHRYERTSPEQPSRTDMSKRRRFMSSEGTKCRIRR